MSGSPLKLMVDPQAKPVAHYTHVPVPLHGQDDVKAHLDQDVRLSVLEPVSIDGPVTWCHLDQDVRLSVLEPVSTDGPVTWCHLDQDVRLSVLEPVSIDGPVTWSHRMVVCAKKKDKHCRAVFQSFTAHAKSKTHHTQSPFQ